MRKMDGPGPALNADSKRTKRILLTFYPINQYVSEIGSKKRRWL